MRFSLVIRVYPDEGYTGIITVTVKVGMLNMNETILVLKGYFIDIE